METKIDEYFVIIDSELGKDFVMQSVIYQQEPNYYFIIFWIIFQYGANLNCEEKA